MIDEQLPVGSRLRSLYKVNLAFVGAVLLTSLFGVIVSFDLDEPFWMAPLMFLGLTYATIGWPVFISFMVLNIWMAIVWREKRPLFTVITLALVAFNGFFGYSSIVWWLNGALLP